MPGFDNNTVYAGNLDFSGNANVTPQVTTDGQVLIGSTVAPNIRVSTISHADGSITVTNGAGTIDLSGTQATSAQKGSVTLASNAETIAGADTSKAVTPDDLKAKLGVQTAHGVLIGEGQTSAVTALSAGTAGQVLRSGGALADPAYSTATYPSTTGAGEMLLSNAANTVISSASMTGDFTYTSATAGTERIVTVTNTDNTNAASSATLKLTTGGANAGDAKAQFSTTTTTWSMGIDNSATVPSADPFVISQNASLGTSDVMRISTAGEVTFPLQSAFSAYLGATVLNKTGAGTAYQLGTDALTEIFDRNSDFVTSGTFTAPVTGLYVLAASMNDVGNDTLVVTHIIQIVTSNRTYSAADHVVPNGNNGSAAGCFICDMDAGDTAVANAYAFGSGAGNTTDIYGEASFATGFQGFLLG